jgi:hypothetical protein
MQLPLLVGRRWVFPFSRQVEELKGQKKRCCLSTMHATMSSIMLQLSLAELRWLHGPPKMSDRLQRYCASQCGAQNNAHNLFLKVIFIPSLTYDELMTLREWPQHTKNCHKHCNHDGRATSHSSGAINKAFNYYFYLIHC